MIQIPIKVITLAKLTPNQYCFLYCIYHKLPLLYIGDVEREELGTRAYIYTAETGEFVLRKEALILFEGAKGLEVMFTEFWNLYPFKVPNGTGGYRVLRTQDVISKQALEVRKKYFGIVKNEETHKTIMNGLQGYLKQQRNAMQYVVGIEVFLNKKLWERYVSIAEDVDKFSDDI
jgi:hypothetical protein